MRGGQRSPTVVGSDFGSWLVAREPALHRTATLLTGDETAGRDLTRPALARLLLEWGGLDPLDADDRARALLLREHRRAWRRAGSDASPSVPDGEYGDAAAAAWALLGVLPPRSRAIVVLRLHQRLTERETADLLRLGAAAVRADEAAVIGALREYLDGERARHPERWVPGDAVALLAATLHDRGEDTSYLGNDPVEIDAAARALSGRRRRRTTVGLVAALAAVVVVGTALTGPTAPAPDRRGPREAPVAAVGPLGSFDADDAPGVPYLIHDLFVGNDGTRREVPVAHPRSATPYRGDLWVTELYFDVFDTLRRVDADGKQTGKWATSGDPVISDDGRTLAWVEELGTRSVIHRGPDRQRVGEPIWLVGLLGDRVVYNGTRAGGVWITDLASAPRAIPGLALARGVDPATGTVSGTATNGDGAVVDAETGVARWRSSHWRPEAFSPDGRHVVALGASRDEVVQHAILETTRGRTVAVIPSSGVGILDLRWEDDEHVLLLATARGQSSILRSDLDGSLTEATRPLRADEVGGSAYQFAVR